MIQSIKQIALMYLATAIGGLLGILLATRDMETIGAGLLGSLLLLPSIIGYAIFDQLKPKKWFKHAAYLIPCLCLLIYFGLLLPFVFAIDETALDIGIIAVLTIGSGGVAGYGVALKGR